MRIRRLITIASTLTLVLVIASFGMSSIKRRTETTSCRKTMSSNGIAALLWANDNNQKTFPDSLVQLSNEIGSTRILICPGDHSRQPASSWTTLTSSNCSYEILHPNLLATDPTNAFLRCKIHGHLGYTDSRVVDGVAPR